MVLDVHRSVMHQNRLVVCLDAYPQRIYNLTGVGFGVVRFT